MYGYEHLILHLYYYAAKMLGHECAIDLLIKSTKLDYPPAIIDYGCVLLNQANYRGAKVQFERAKQFSGIEEQKAIFYLEHIERLINPPKYNDNALQNALEGCETTAPASLEVIAANSLRGNTAMQKRKH